MRQKIARIFENEALIAVDKPHAWLTTPARELNDPRPVLGPELQRELGIQIYPVHRLDFEVSGLVLFAKTAQAHRVLQGWFEKGEIQKTYEALSAGLRPVGEWVEWQCRIVRGKRRSFEAPHGKEAITRARVVSADEFISRWELMPLTGRPHQLRMEMARHGSPILGDKLYSGAQWAGHEASEIALRAVSLNLGRVQGERFGMPGVLSVAGL